MALVYAEKKQTNPGKQKNLFFIRSGLIWLVETLDNILISILLLDKEVIQELDSKVKEDRKTASPKSLYYAGTLLWLMGRNEKAREYTERMIKLSNGSKEVRVYLMPHISEMPCT